MFLPSTHEEVAILCAKPCACGVLEQFVSWEKKKKLGQTTGTLSL